MSMARIGSSELRRKRLKRAREIETHTAYQWLLLKMACDGCVVCGAGDQDTDEHEFLTRDHIIPVSLGGHDGLENIQPMCRTCNSTKGARAMDDLRPGNWRLWYWDLWSHFEGRRL
jgi:5-methylcytosine-specific restriction endonuclease McrA